MDKNKITDAQIIDALGGPAPVAKQLGLPKPTVQAWKSPKRRIPPQIRLDHPRLIAKGIKLAMEKFVQT